VGGKALYSEIRKFILVFVVVSVPTTALAADWLLRWHSGFWQSVEPLHSAQEVRKLYQLREFCRQSNTIEKRLDFAIQKLREKKDYWNSRAARWESRPTDPKHVTINFGPSENPTLYDPYFKGSESQTSPLFDWRNSRIHNLRNRNSKYLEKIFDNVREHGPENASIWGTLQAKHDEISAIINSGDFQACMAELDSVLPTSVKNGGRE
jgi:hypothetical protein